jgi:hypothetical protein
MRPFLAKLVPLSLLLVGLSAPAALAGREDRPTRKPELVKESQSTSLKIEGDWQSSREAAWEDALVKAQEQVYFHLRQRYPSMTWTPDLKYIDRRLVKDRKEEEEQREVIPGERGTARRLVLQVKVTPDDYRDMVNQDRQEKVKARMLLLGKLLLGIVLILGLVAGYFRLDEATKGYHTGLLRLAAVTLLGVAGAVLWILVVD